MPFIGKIASPATTLDHQTNSFAATEGLLLTGQDYAFVEKDDQIVGIICLENLLEEYMSANTSENRVEDFMKPLFFVKEHERRSKALELMLMNDIEYIAVANRSDDFVGVVSLKQLKMGSQKKPS